MNMQPAATAFESRRDILKFTAGGVMAGALMTAIPRQASAQTLQDIDLLNFALNFKYMLAQYFSYAATGAGIAPTSLTGTGTAGPVTVGRRVTFTDTLLGSIAAEMQLNTRDHLGPVRTAIGALAIAQASIDISSSPTAGFSLAMQRAGVVAAGASFDPYGSEENFLYAAYLLNDISVSAFRGLLATVSNRVIVQMFAGILATECYHFATIRSLLYTRGATTPRFRQNADRISAYCRSIAGAAPFEQGVSPRQRTYAAATGQTSVSVSGIVPADTTGEVTGRTPGQILNLLYLNAGQVAQGGFFPAGVNGAIRSSSAA